VYERSPKLVQTGTARSCRSSRVRRSPICFRTPSNPSLRRPGPRWSHPATCHRPELWGQRAGAGEWRHAVRL